MEPEKNKDKNKGTKPNSRPDQQAEGTDIEQISNVISSLP